MIDFSLADILKLIMIGALILTAIFGGIWAAVGLGVLLFIILAVIGFTS